MAAAVLVAVVASIGNLLQGWDTAAIGGAVLYIKKEFPLENAPMIEGLIVAMPLVGTIIMAAFSGAAADSIGRRPLLIASSVFYFLSGLAMLWSPSVPILLLGRVIDGFGVGLAVTLVPVYISETAPSEIRGFLNTLPQFSGCAGMFLSYCMVFAMSVMPKTEWSLMLGVISIPSVLYILLTFFYLPESPRWLVSKGRMKEAKQVLQRLRGKSDIAGEMALLVEGLSVGGNAQFEELLFGSVDGLTGEVVGAELEKVTLYGAEEGHSWIATSVKGQHFNVDRAANNACPISDPVVNLFGSVHAKMPEVLGSLQSNLFPNFGSMFSLAEQQQKDEEWDEEAAQREEEEPPDDTGGFDTEEGLETPLLVQEITGSEEVTSPDNNIETVPRSSTLMMGPSGEAVSSMGIGGKWKLAWSWTEKGGEEKDSNFKRIYLHQGSVPGQKGSMQTIRSCEGNEYAHASALMNLPALFSELKDQHVVGPYMVHPSEIAHKGSRWKDLLEPGVKHALTVGIGLQILQQFAGINGVLYYTPQILEQAGVCVLLEHIGISATSSSILISAVITLLMLPFIGIAMRQMDLTGRRFLLLVTIPILIVSLVILVIVNAVNFGAVVHAVLSLICVIIYLCSFVMGFGPVPNILCSEIFPTRVRGICIATCALTFWIGDIIVTYSLPLMLSSIGLAGVFGICAAACVIAFVFVLAKVPETKGMPLEVITEFFAVGVKQQQESKPEASDWRVDVN